MNDIPDILRKILARKREEIAARASRLPLQVLRQRAESTPAPRGFLQAIRSRLAAGRPAVIAEIKKASPSKGLLRADFRPADIARSYELLASGTKGKRFSLPNARVLIHQVMGVAE